MSQAIIANPGAGKSWRDGKWTWTRDRDTLGPSTNSQTLDKPRAVSTESQSKFKQVVTSTIMSTDSTETREGDPLKIDQTAPTKKKGSRFALNRFSISELADPSLVQPPKALVAQNEIGWRSKSTSSLSNLARRGSRIIRTTSPIRGHRKTPSTHVSKPEKAVVNPLPVSPAEELEVIMLKPPKPRQPSSAPINRPLSTIITRSASSPQMSSMLHKTRSVEGLPRITVDSPTSIPDLPTPVTPSRIQRFRAAPADVPRKKDELWNAFRSLDQEHSKFVNKPISFKAALVKSSILPFLQQHANHPSCNSLRVEDLDRRVNILNKWWTSLLESINGRNGYGIAPSDRPTILDALTGIMQRPEWHQTASTLASSRQNTSKTASSLSLSSTGSDFLVETVLSNTRSMFVQNLLLQVNFAVDRLSLRTVAASMVAYCGKALAYAFLYCPGVADVLVRLWSPQQINLRRVLDEAGLPRNTNFKSTADSVADLFPTHLQHLALKSLPSLHRTLRESSPIRINLDHINWNGPWIGRWSGRDSDLFFSFTKHYHTIVHEILGDDATIKERLCAPGAVLIYGQLLSCMDATVQVHKNPQIPSQGVTFDDILGPDTSAAAMSIKGVNTARSMAENRIIMLLREVLSDSSAIPSAAKISFAALFGNLLKATTKRTSVNDGDACFMLCDFLEESMIILSRFFRNSEDPTAFLDWPFWLDVLKRLGESNNTMTEVRLYSFIYSLWGYITKDEGKKRDLCLNWLLKEEYAYRQFNHWCPMVRAYYQRLLVWRIARCYGSASALDIEIYTTLLVSLQRMFNQYLSKLSAAEQQGLMLPSTTPASPAPGRRLLIIRDDSVMSPTAVLPTFLTSSTDHSTFQKFNSIDTLNKLVEGPDLSGKAAKRRFTFLRNLNPFGNVADSTDSSNSTSPQNSPPSSTHTPGESEGTSTPDSQSSRPSTPPTPIPGMIPSRSFKFSLEWIDRSYLNRKDKTLYPPRLPPTSQAVVSREITDAILIGDTAPSRDEEASSRYIGIALAEWSILVVECAAFAERRKCEGVPAGREETPVLGVETFRKPIG